MEQETQKISKSPSDQIHFDELKRELANQETQQMPQQTVNEPYGAYFQKIEQLPVEIQQKEPIIHKKIIRQEVHEVQTIIHRERIVTEVKRVTQPIYMHELLPVQFENAELPAEKRSIGEEFAYHAPEEVSKPIEFEPEFVTEAITIKKPPIIQEVIKKRTIEEVQPVVYKEILEPHVVKCTQDVTEKVMEPLTIVQETAETQYVEEAIETGFEPGAAGDAKNEMKKEQEKEKILVQPNAQVQQKSAV